MKVLILATDIFTRGGIARYTSTVASSLGRMLGAENVDVLCFFDWGNAGERPSEFGLLGTVSGRARAGAWSRAHFMLKAAGAGFRGYDLVIANHVALTPVAAAMKRVFGIPYWVACHSIEIWWGTTRWRHAALKNADLILPVSRYTADVVRKMEGIQGSRVKVVYNAIPDSFARLLVAGKGRESSNGCVAQAGLRVGAGERVQGRGHGDPSPAVGVKGGAGLAVRGGGRGRDTGWVGATGGGNGRGGERYVHWRNPGRGIGGVVSRLRCVRVAEPGTGTEGRGRRRRIWTRAGKPVVGSRSGGASEAVLQGRTGFVVDPESVDEVAEALSAILGDRQLAGRMGSAGRAWSLDMFSEEALAGALAELLGPYGFRNESVAELVKEAV